MSCKHTESIRSYFKAATPEQIKAGKAWYKRARSLVFELSMVYGTTEETVAGVIAALSQRTRWSTNIDRATHLLDGHDDVGGLPLATEKAIAIRDGADPVETLGPNAHKVRAFYLALLGDDDQAVVDTWMLQALGWDRSGYSKSQYEILADIIRAEAELFGLATTEYQAAVWCVIRGNAD